MNRAIMRSPWAPQVPCELTEQVCATFAEDARLKATQKLQTRVPMGYTPLDLECELTTSTSPMPTPQTAPVCAHLTASGTGGSAGSGGSAPGCGESGAYCLDDTGCCASLHCALNACD